MKSKNMFIGLLFIIFIFAAQSFSQTKEQRLAAAGDVIDGLLKNDVGPQYHCVFGVDVDSTLGDVRFYSYPMEDPYGTLQHCIIFTGGRDTKEGNFVGVYKNGAILWRSDTTILGYQPNLFTTEDLNRSGQVDLVFESGIDQSSQLWIFCWDGHVGKRISAIDSRGQSVLQSVSHSFELFDADGDGILEIKDGNVADGSQTWSWNGSEFGSWPDTPHLPSTTLWPRNKIDVVIHCNVTGSTNQFIFNYSLYSKPSSLQEVYDVRIWGRCDSVRENSAPVRWEVDYNNGRGSKFFSYWSSDPMNPIRRLIMPGEMADGFKTVAFGLPAIEEYDAQGFNAFPNYSLMTDQQVMDIQQRDETENSVHGFTIAPINPPSPFIPLAFLDTLNNYTTQSRTLGWIKDQTTANRYLGYFASAKTSLVQNNITSTRATLQQVLDSTATLTSEAYALIRFNTEYLLAQLPIPLTGCNVKLINSTGTKLTGGTLQYYDGSWKDAVNNNDGTFSVTTNLKTISLRMTYQVRHTNKIECHGRV